MLKNTFLDKRRAGILLPISALPEILPENKINSELISENKLNIDKKINNIYHQSIIKNNGDFSQAFSFIDFLDIIGCSVWQILPLGPTHQDKSPYQCLSVHAGNPLFISLDWLCEHEYLPKLYTKSRVILIDQDKKNYLHQAFTVFLKNKNKHKNIRKAYDEFILKHKFWLDDYALFMSIRHIQNNKHWIEWNSELRDRSESALETVKISLRDSINEIKFEQFIFYQQWQEIKAYAQTKNILLFGDMPLFVSHDSVDVWAHRDLFILDKHGRAEVVAGVPPDYFSDQGQCWGNPHYYWPALQAENFKWWLERLNTELERVDLLRIDHFRGLSASWAIPADAKTAAEGYWLPVPGYELLKALNDTLKPLPLIAEDLGIITPDVEHLRDQFHLPGMKILQFAFDGGSDNPYLPEHHIENCVLYTGTHDNNTSLAWYHSLDEYQKNKVDNILNNYINKDSINYNDNMPWPLIYCALASVAKLVILPMQDILSLDEGNRTNTPGTIDNKNWRWRFSWTQITPKLLSELNALFHFYR